MKFYTILFVAIFTPLIGALQSDRQVRWMAPATAGEIEQAGRK